MRDERTVRELYRRLMRAYGPQGWWPAKTSFEVCVGAVLTQNIRWRNVEHALSNLRSEGLLDPWKLRRIPSPRLQRLIRPAGYYRRKASTLKALSALLIEACAGDPARLAQWGLDAARRKLLGIRGIGEETADCILLYAAELPVFVVDAMTRRIVARHRLLPDSDGDGGLRGLFLREYPSDVGALKEIHALLDRVGKERCRRDEALCEGCPLESLLPPAGPWMPEGSRPRAQAPRAHVAQARVRRA